MFAAGCSDDGQPAAGPTPSTAAAPTGLSEGDAIEPTGPPAPTEGPAAAGASWPDGLSAKLVAVERVPNSWGVDVPKSMAVVRLTLEVRNGTQAVLPIVPMSGETSLLYGPNRQEAESEAGYSYPDPDEAKRKQLTADGGTRIPVGGTARFVESWLVPVSALGDLTVVVDLPAVDGMRVPFTLTDVEALLKQVR